MLVDRRKGALTRQVQRVVRGPGSPETVERTVFIHGGIIAEHRSGTKGLG
jgi:hypothetical protein